MRYILAASLLLLASCTDCCRAQDCGRPAAYSYSAPMYAAPQANCGSPAAAYGAPMTYSAPVVQYAAPMVYAAPQPQLFAVPGYGYTTSVVATPYSPTGYAAPVFSAAPNFAAPPPGYRHYRYRNGLFGVRVDAW